MSKLSKNMASFSVRNVLYFGESVSKKNFTLI